MPIKTTITRESIIARFDTQIENLMQDVVQALHNAGLEAVTHARQQHQYTDRTGNLTSSINYAIVRDGEILTKGDTFTILDGSEGTEEAEKVIKETAADLKGLNLIMVAGMPYATYVEAMGLDVLDSAHLVALNSAKSKIDDVIKLWSE